MVDEIELFIEKLNKLCLKHGCKLGSAANNVVRIDYKAPSLFVPEITVLIVWDNETRQYVRG